MLLNQKKKKMTKKRRRMKKKQFFFIKKTEKLESCRDDWFAKPSIIGTILYVSFPLFSFFPFSASATHFYFKGQTSRFSSSFFFFFFFFSSSSPVSTLLFLHITDKIYQKYYRCWRKNKDDQSWRGVGVRMWVWR